MKNGKQHLSRKVIKNIEGMLSRKLSEGGVASKTYYRARSLLSYTPIKQQLSEIDRKNSPLVVKRKILKVLSKNGYFCIDGDLLDSLKMFVWTKNPAAAYQRSLIQSKLVRCRKGVKKTEELWVRIYPNTKIEDVKDGWFLIENLQKQLPGYQEKERRWSTFDRDMDIYWSALKYKEKLRKQREKGIRIGEKERWEFYDETAEKYGIESSQAIRKIISRVNKLLAPLRH